MATQRWLPGRSRRDHALGSRRGPLETPEVAGAWPRRVVAGGVRGNERLTVAAGWLLGALLAPLGVTILRIRPLLGVHMFLGLLLIPPVLLKIASTGYRFVRYYKHSPAYRRKGPPAAKMRALAPGVVASTVGVFASGVALLLIGPSSRGWLLSIHKLSFLAWIGLTALHVLGHLTDLSPSLSKNTHDGLDPRANGSGRGGRLLALAGVLLAGVVLAILYLPRFTPWLHAHQLAGAR